MPLWDREKHRGNYHLDNMERLAEVKHKNNSNMPLKLLSLLRQRCLVTAIAKKFCSPAHLLNVFSVCL